MALSDNPETIAQLLEAVAKHASIKFDNKNLAQLQTLPLKPFPSSSLSDPENKDIDLATRIFLSTKLTQEGAGLKATVGELIDRIGPSLSNSAGSRYFGLVTGGVTPAAFIADWIVTTYDQNTILHSPEAMSGYSVITEQAMKMVVDLFNLPREQGPRRPASEYTEGDENYFRAMTTSGSTASNVVGMAVGRQWLGIHERGLDYCQDGYDGQVVVITNMAHSSVWKAASILGIGRKQVIEVPGMGSSEDDPEENAFETEVEKWKKAGKAILVFLAFGEVNTGIFPKHTRRIAEISKKYNAYLHIDGAFGIYARCSPKYAQLADGLELAHSITACGHKWLNVPYDCGLFLFRQSLEKSIMEPLFSSSAAYLKPSETPFSHPMNISIENSQRFRALPVWATLRAYGREGYKRIIEENCQFAKTMFDWMKNTRPDLYTVLTEECPLNIVVFAKSHGVNKESSKTIEILESENAALLNRINQTGVAYFSPTVWNGRPAIRAAISNWKTTVELDWEPVRVMLEEQAAAE